MKLFFDEAPSQAHIKKDANANPIKRQVWQAIGVNCMELLGRQADRGKEPREH